jgi:hypothetical protein
MIKIIFMIGMALILIAPGSTLATTTTDFRVFVTNGNTIHDLNVKASQGANGQVIPVSGFVIDPEDVVLLREGQNLVVMTSTNEPQRIDKVKIVNQAGQFIELPQLQAGTWSLVGITAGVYLLDVIVDTPDSNTLVAYETVLVILGPNQQPLPVTQYLTMVQSVEVKTKVEFVFEEDKCTNNPGSAGMGFPYQKVSECEVEGVEDCRKNNIDSNYCDGLKERFADDCDGFSSQEECDEYWYTPPVCDENTPAGTTCIDEGDPDDCEPGFVDRGFGCEQEVYDQCPPGSAPVDWCTPPNSGSVVEEEPEEIVDENDTPEPPEPEDGQEEQFEDPTPESEDESENENDESSEEDEG